MGSNIYISATGVAARLHDLDVVANNLANLSTIGFKRQQPVFESIMESAIRKESGDLQAGAPGRAFVAVSRVTSDFTSGGIQATGAPLDVAIQGPGFFEVETSDGPRYTRAGSFGINAEGALALSSGEAVVGRGGRIEIGSREARIEPSGRVIDTAGEELGRLQLVRFSDRQSLRRMGKGLFAADPAQEKEDVEEPHLAVGALEKSNVLPMRELSSLVVLQRAFDSNMRAIQADDETTNLLIQEFSR